MTKIKFKIRKLSTVILASLALSGAVLPPSNAHATEALVISRDYGGSVMQRLRELNNLRMQRTPVKVVGQCMSACTMYLGLPQTCVSANAVFGFHGPSRRGQSRALTNSSAAELLAAHYPPALRQWYLREGQYVASDRVIKISGRDMHRMGVPRC